MPLQLFDNILGIDQRFLGTNICLCYDMNHTQKHLFTDDVNHRVRMNRHDWTNQYAFGYVDSWLTSSYQPCYNKTRLKPFYICPELADSYITPAIANHFNLENYLQKGIGITRPYPYFRLFGQNPIPIQAQGFYDVYLTICATISVAPELKTRQIRFYCLVGDDVPVELAIIGRNALKYLLLLYRAKNNYIYCGYDNGENDMDSTTPLK